MGHATRRKSMRRSHLKKFSSTIVGGTSSIDKHYFAEANARAAYRDDYYLNLYGIKLPDDLTAPIAHERSAQLGVGATLLRTSREEVQEKLINYLKAVPHKNHICLLPQRLFMWWVTGEQYFFVKYDSCNETCYRSINYRDRVQAMFAFNIGRIAWRMNVAG